MRRTMRPTLPPRQSRSPMRHRRIPQTRNPRQRAMDRHPFERLLTHDVKPGLSGLSAISKTNIFAHCCTSGSCAVAPCRNRRQICDAHEAAQRQSSFAAVVDCSRSAGQSLGPSALKSPVSAEAPRDCPPKQEFQAEDSLPTFSEHCAPASLAVPLRGSS
jgi:hypothetical protein